VCQDDRLARLRKAVQGSWTGTVSTPWKPPYPVTMTFFVNGTYSARCTQPDCVAMYYGTDDDSPEKRYDIQDLRSDDKGRGEVVFYFGPGNTNGGELRGMEVSGDGNALSFEAWKGTSGPLKFSLRRSPAP